ncbi:hypothetical protein ACJ2A9_04310 [Anaerobacillus sp. MEB173]|uniref:hypothetical protein n=1 Tax=Anaerobacillus sp. MEB173 TaxID=3383345 RepID=UPI003F90C0BA
MVTSLLLLIPVSIVVLLAFIMLAFRKNPDQGGDEMLKNVYIYLVLFATLMMTIGGSVAAFMAAADIISPAPYYQSFEEYKRWGKPELANGEQEVTLSEEELRENYEAMIRTEVERTKQRAVNNLIKSFGWIVIPLPIFIYFQRRLRGREDLSS